MKAWARNGITEGRAAEARLAWVFAAALALFVVALLGLGSVLRFIW